MMLRTHLAMGLAIALYFLPHVNNKLIFFPIALVSSALPDIGTILSFRKTRRFKSLRREPFLSKIIKTYTFCVAVSLLLASFYPIAALPFFLGYSFHLILDAFTPEGIQPFWPLKNKMTGRASKGGTVDITLFVVFVIADFALFIKLFL